MGLIMFNGVSSLDYGIQVEHGPGYSTPEKDYEVKHVPGRNGDVCLDKGSYKNTTRTYEVSLGSLEKDFTDMASALSDWLHSASGYARLEDSYEPEYYRKAIFVEKTDMTNILGHGVRAKINFNCKPQRFLKSGELAQKITTAGVKLYNPTNYTAKPIITITGKGTVTCQVGKQMFTIKIDRSESWTMIINCDLEDAYYNGGSMNQYLTLNNGTFPVLTAGENLVSYSGTVENFEIIPNWWRL